MHATGPTAAAPRAPPHGGTHTMGRGKRARPGVRSDKWHQLAEVNHPHRLRAMHRSMLYSKTNETFQSAGDLYTV